MTTIDMRHTKLKASEAALLAGELHKPSWQSQNEGIHERVSFEDSIWGFDLAGGSFYNTPLRVVSVKPDSRAEKAGIRKGDNLIRINDIDTSTLTIQEAHEIIIESGVHLRIAVTAPDDEEDSYYCYEDPLQSGYDSDEERRKELEREKKRQVHAKVSSYWSLQWPWVSKRRIIYRESNCFMVPSKYESHHRDKFPVTDSLRTPEDIILESQRNEQLLKEKQLKEELAKGTPNGNETPNSNDVPNGHEVINGNGIPNGSEIPNGDVVLKNANPDDNENINTNNTEVNGMSPIANGINGIANGESDIEEPIENQTVIQNGDITENTNKVSNGEANLTTADESTEIKDDQMIDEVLQSEESVSKAEEEMIIDSILSEGEEHEEPNSEETDER